MRSTDLREDITLLECRSLARIEEVANVVSHRLEDPDTGEQLEVHTDPQQPGRVGEVVLLVDDVGDQCRSVERRLVAADLEHRVPRVIRSARVGNTGRGRLAGRVHRHQPVEEPLVERAEVADVAHVEQRRVGGDGRALSNDLELDPRLAHERRRKPELDAHHVAFWS